MNGLLRAEAEKKGKSSCCDEAEELASSLSVSGEQPLINVRFNTEKRMGKDELRVGEGVEETIEGKSSARPSSPHESNSICCACCTSC